MKKNFTYTLLIVFTLGATITCAQNRITGSKTYITKNVTVKSFKHILVVGSPDVVYTQTNSGSPKIEIYGSDNIVSLIETTVEDNTLTVKYPKNTNITNGKIEVRVSAPAVESMKVQGSGDIHIPNGYSGASLKLNVTGSGDIKGKNITCENLYLSVSGSGDVDLSGVKAVNIENQVSGSGDIRLKGTSQMAKYSVAGSGDIKATELIADHVEASVAGSGDIACYAEKTLKGSISGSGGIGYKGNPEISFAKKGLRKL